MPKINPKIKSIDDLLRLDAEFTEQHKETKTTEQEIGITTISIAKIRMFRNHPFRLYDGERLDDMVESVRANGVLIPAIVRKIEPDENGCEYEMLSGHNRMKASHIGGHDELPCIVKENLSDEDALIYVVETNLLQRSFADMLPSEKAAVLSLHYSKMFSQGKRNDIISEHKMLENPQYINENSTCGNECHFHWSMESLILLSSRSKAHTPTAVTSVRPSWGQLPVLKTLQDRFQSCLPMKKVSLPILSGNLKKQKKK